MCVERAVGRAVKVADRRKEIPVQKNVADAATLLQKSRNSGESNSSHAARQVVSVTTTAAGTRRLMRLS